MSTTPLGSFVKLLVLDPQASAAFYERLGFVRVGADGTFIHLRYGAAGDVFLVGVPSGVRVEGKRAWGVLLCFTTEAELEALAETARSAGAPVQGPEQAPWHTREVIITDPDGYRLNFVRPA